MALNATQWGIMSQALAAVKNSIPEGVTTADQVPEPSFWDKLSSIFNANATANPVISYNSMATVYQDYSDNPDTVTVEQFATFYQACKALAKTTAWDVFNLDAQYAALPPEEQNISIVDKAKQVAGQSDIGKLLQSVLDTLKSFGTWVVIVLGLILTIYILKLFPKKG